MARHPREEQYSRIAARLIKNLEGEGGARIKASLPQLKDCVVKVLLKGDAEVEELDRAAKALLEQHLRAAPPGLDRAKMLTMIRKKLAQEKGVPL